MLSKAIPDINTVFSMLIQQERQMNSEIQEPRVMANGVAPRGRGRGTRGSRTSNGGRAGNGRGCGNKVCTFCDLVGHIVDTCYKKHEYPPHYFKKNEGKMINNCTQDNEEFEDNDDSNSVIQENPPKENASSIFPFTAAQRDVVLALL